MGVKHNNVGFRCRRRVSGCGGAVIPASCDCQDLWDKRQLAFFPIAGAISPSLSPFSFGTPNHLYPAKMKPSRLLALLISAASTTVSAADDDSIRTAAVYIQPITSPSSAVPIPSLLAELRYPASASTSPASEQPSVLSYEAPDLDSSSSSLAKIGTYDPSSKQWSSSTSVISTKNFGKGYSPHFLLSVGDGGVVSVTLKGVRIDAGQTRDFGPQVVVRRTDEGGVEPSLGKNVVLSPDGRKVGAEGEKEKSFLQK